MGTFEFLRLFLLGSFIFWAVLKIFYILLDFERSIEKNSSKIPKIKKNWKNKKCVKIYFKFLTVQECFKKRLRKK